MSWANRCGWSGRAGSTAAFFWFRHWKRLISTVVTTVPGMVLKVCVKTFVPVGLIQ